VTIDLRQLPYNPGYGWYQAKAGVGGHQIVVYVSGRGNTDIDELSKQVNADLAWIDANTGVVTGFASDQLLAEKNHDWVNDEHPAVSAEEFQRRLELGAVRFHPDGGSELTFYDGGLFWNHWVIVWLQPDHSCRQAYLSG
jgi:hypothetical protein